MKELGHSEEFKSDQIVKILYEEVIRLRVLEDVHNENLRISLLGFNHNQ